MRGAIPGITSVKEVRVAKQVVGIISPWNYPLYLGVGDAIPALLAGAAVISKADPQAPLTLLWARALMAEADVDGGLVGGASLSAESFVRLVKEGSAT